MHDCYYLLQFVFPLSTSQLRVNHKIHNKTAKQFKSRDFFNSLTKWYASRMIQFRGGN